MAPDIIHKIPEGGCRRIKNAAERINKTIYIIGSRANNTFRTNSDFDYVITDIKNKEWKKIKNSLPGAKNDKDNLSNRIDLFKGNLDLNLPYIEITPNTLEDECRG